MDKKYTILKWDSHYFGFTVAKIIPDKLDFNELGKILKDLKKRNVSLVYWGADGRDESSQKAAKSLDGFLTGERVTYIANLRNMFIQTANQNIQLEKYNDNVPNNDLIKLILEGGIYSRFYTDPKIGKKQYEELFKVWMNNSVKNNIIFVIKINHKIVAFISLNEKNNRGNIDFIVVDKSCMGKGFGKTLLAYAHKWFISNNYDHIQAITQAENIIACKMYEKCGYHIDRRENFYHFWL